MWAHTRSWIYYAIRMCIYVLDCVHLHIYIRSHLAYFKTCILYISHSQWHLYALTNLLRYLRNVYVLWNMHTGRIRAQWLTFLGVPAARCGAGYSDHGEGNTAFRKEKLGSAYSSTFSILRLLHAFNICCVIRLVGNEARGSTFAGFVYPVCLLVTE